MGVMSRYLRIPCPTRFLGVMSLCTGVEMVSIFMIFNKLTGFYGLLATFTGLSLSSLQLSMYIYSCLAIVIIAYLLPHIRKQSPFQCMILSYFYFFDTIVNTLFTSAFAFNWFLAASNDKNVSIIVSQSETPMITALTNQRYNVSESENKLNLPHSVTAAQEAVVYGVASATASSGTMLEETFPSVALIAALTMIRVYFVFILLAYARQVIRQKAFQASSSKLHLHTDGCADIESGGNPFAVGNSEGTGLRGKIGRIMIKIGEEYWMGDTATDDMWARGLDGRFKISKIQNEVPGTIERERRARSGTGPPIPFIKL
ncbi:hypothetical protein Golomagni_04529 [Golovinomyces magnicellulatus]|nr:hypothetical protein Golomagni_04529 [Golovinomyces magnicellulatus]